MALGILALLYVALIVTATAAQVLLYNNKNKSKNSIFVVNVVVAIGLSFLVFSSLPTNYTGQRTIAIAFGVLALLSILVKLKSTNLLTSKIMLSVAVIGSLVQLFV